MKTKTGMSIGLALTLMVGVFATMLALGLFTTTEVRAAITGASMTLSDNDALAQDVTATIEFKTNVAITATTVFTIDFPDDDAFAGADGILPDAFPVGAPGADPPVPTTVTIKVGGNDTENSLATIATGNVVAVESSDAVAAPGSGEDPTAVTIVLKGLTNPSASYTVAVDSDVSGDEPVGANVSINQLVKGVTVLHEPETPGSAAKVTVTFTPVTDLQGRVDTITIQFADDVKMPIPLDKSEISISGKTRNVGEPTGDPPLRGIGDGLNEPLDVFVVKVGSPADEPEITLTVPDMDPDVDGTQNLLNTGPVSVIFRQGAGITNPTENGNYHTYVKTSKDNAGPDTSSGTSGFVKTAEAFGVKPTVSLNNTKGKRGSTATATGAGFKDGSTVTVWLESDAVDDIQKNGEPTLCSVDKVAKSDTFTCDFVITASFARTGNEINARDGRNNVAAETASWNVDAQIKAVPGSAAVGDTVTVQLRDFPEDGRFVHGAASSDVMELGEVDVEFETFSITSGSGDATITIPNEATLGIQSLQVKLGGASPRTNMTVLGAQLTVTPSTAVPNQTVTVTGRGFSTGAGASLNEEGDSSQFLIGGTAIPEANINSGSDITIDNGGGWVASVIIPVTAPSTTAGTYEFKVVDSLNRPGVTSITIPDRTVTFDPPESRGGTTVNVTGTGWVATNAASQAPSDIDVEYVSDTGSSSARATPDSNGAFSTTIQVPRNAPIPSTNQVTVSYEVAGESPVSEQFSHRVPGAEITISPSSGPGGTVATLTGVGFKAFTSLDSVHVGDTRTAPSPVGASVGRDGVLQTVTILIPALDPGTLAVKVDVSGSIASTPFTITDDDALPPPADDQAPADAFAALIDSGSLITVFRYNEDTQAYQSYDPDPANAGFNDLDTVNSGDIFWVRLSEDQTFLGKLRRAPWAQVVLP